MGAFYNKTAPGNPPTIGIQYAGYPVVGAGCCLLTLMNILDTSMDVYTLLSVCLLMYTFCVY